MIITQTPRRIGYVQATWHSDILDGGYDSFVEEWTSLGGDPDLIDRYSVPGALEIPLHAKMLAKSSRYAGIVASGWIIDAGVYAHEFVASSVISALMQIQMETEVPVFSMVLTPHHFHDHADHVKFFTDNFVVKGQEAARAAWKTLDGLDRIKALG